MVIGYMGNPKEESIYYAEFSDVERDYLFCNVWRSKYHDACYVFATQINGRLLTQLSRRQLKWYHRIKESVRLGLL